MANTYKNDIEVTSPTDANIFGHVVDKATGEHLPGITIILKGTTIGSVTDDSGHYMLKNLPEGEFTIEVSFVGFKTVTKKVTTGKGKTQELNFELEEDLISLEGVVASFSHTLLYRCASPRTTSKRSSTIVSPGIRRNTSAASLSCVLPICWAEIPLTTGRLFRTVLIMAGSVPNFRCATTTTF